MAACLCVPKVSELHSALRRELVWHVVYAPATPLPFMVPSWLREMESHVIPPEDSCVDATPWTRVVLCKSGVLM